MSPSINSVLALSVMSDILLGTCGWSYAEWKGILYPQKQSKLKQWRCSLVDWFVFLFGFGGSC